MNSLKRGSNEETQTRSRRREMCPNQKRKYTHNSHSFIIWYINMILSRTLFSSFTLFAIGLQASNQQRLEFNVLRNSQKLFKTTPSASRIASSG